MLPVAMLLPTLIAAGLLAGGPAPDVPAGDPAPPFPTGQVIEKVACLGDPDRSYALYLPSGYTPSRRWPVLIAMDPRGRALIPLDLFRPAAERLGVIVMSSYDTRSDGPREPNVMALRAMLPDMERRLAADTRRVMLTGFSGTARAGWDFAVLLDGMVAGVIGVGAGYPAHLPLPDPLPFAFYGAAGHLDFNFDEMLALDLRLARAGARHRFAPFPGPHRWPPREICTAALEWMEVQAMAAGLRPRDEVLLEELLALAVARAGELEAAGRPGWAREAYAAAAADFQGLAGAAAAQARADALGARPDVQALAARQAELLAQREDYERRFAQVLQELTASRQPPPLVRAVRKLDLRELGRRAALLEDDDPLRRLDAEAARRILEHVFGVTSFYQVRQFLEEDRPAHALAVLRIAGEIRPGDPRVCLAEARIHAREGRVKKGLEALACAIASGQLDAAMVEADADLAPLRAADGYRALWPATGPALP